MTPAGEPQTNAKARKPTRVCIVASTYPRSESDVAVPWLRQEVKLLAERGYDVTVFAPSHKGLGDHTVDGIQVRRFRYFLASKEDLTHDSGAPSKVHKIGYLGIAGCYVLRGTLAFTRFQKKERFDIVHIHWPLPHGNFVRLLRGANRPKVVLNFHGAELALARKSGVFRKNLVASVKIADAIIANSTHTANEVRRLAGERHIEIKGYGCPVEAAHPPATRPLKPTILYVGRLIERKGIPYLIEAFALLRKDVDAQLLLVGKGVLHDELAQQIDQSGLQDSVKLLSDIGNEALAELYLSSTVFVLPAIVDSKGDTEGLGVVLIEAMTFGLPVVASNVGGIPDVVINERTGLLVPEKDPRALAEALKRVIADPETADKFTVNAQKHIESCFSWHAVIEKLDILYGRLGNPTGTQRCGDAALRASSVVNK